MKPGWSAAHARYARRAQTPITARSATPAQVHASADPFVRQFVDGEPDGPVPFHYPARPYAEELAASAG